jgi:hypothetical protein
MYCLRVNVYCHRVPTQLQLANISISININFAFFKTFRTAGGGGGGKAHPTSCRSRYRGSFRKTRRLGCEVVHSDSYSAESKNTPSWQRPLKIHLWLVLCNASRLLENWQIQLKLFLNYGYVFLSKNRAFLYIRSPCEYTRQPTWTCCLIQILAFNLLT